MVNTHATIEAGVLVGSMLYGVVTIQAFSYIEAGKKDATWIRLFIAWMWILETGNTALAWVYLNQLTVFGPGVNDPTALGRIYWSFVACIVSHDCLSAAVQSFYAYRLYVLSGRIAFSLVQWIGSVLRIAFIFTLLGFALSAPSLGELLIQHRGLAIGTVSTSAIVDMWNTAMLCWHLKKFRRRGTRQTSRMVDRIILWSVETGLLTSVSVICVLFVMLAIPHAAVWEGVWMIYSKFYSLALLVSLNARGYLRGTSEHTEPHILELVSEIQRKSQRSPTPIEVSVVVVRKETNDDESFESPSSPRDAVGMSSTPVDEEIFDYSRGSFKQVGSSGTSACI